MRYRDYDIEIDYNAPKFALIRYAHKDYDGPEDARIGACATHVEAMEAVDELVDDEIEVTLLMFMLAYDEVHGTMPAPRREWTKRLLEEQLGSLAAQARYKEKHGKRGCFSTWKMFSLSNHHSGLDESGEGKCSVPMWSGGCPAGFCDAPAFSKPPPGRVIRRWDGYLYREDGRYAGYVPALACVAHGGLSREESSQVLSQDTDK